MLYVTFVRVPRVSIFCYHFMSLYTKTRLTVMFRKTLDRKLRRKAGVCSVSTACLCLLYHTFRGRRGLLFALCSLGPFLAAVRYINSPCRKVQSLSKCIDWRFFQETWGRRLPWRAAHCCRKNVALTVLHIVLEGQFLIPFLLSTRTQDAC
jgi:hypothetical protein